MTHSFFRTLTVLFVLLLATQVHAHIPVQTFKTNKNIQVIFVENNKSDLISLEFAFKGMGSRLDPKGKEGLTLLMTELLSERTKKGSEKHLIEKQLKNLGALSGIQSQVNSDHILYRVKFPAEKIKEIFEILRIVFTEREFDATELEQIKSFDPPDARLASASERGFASKVLMQTLFQGHAYAFPNYGTLDGRQSITVTDVAHCATQRFTRNTLAFSVIGKVSRKELEACIDQAFGHLPEKNNAEAFPFPSQKMTGKTTFIPKNSPQAGVVFAQKAVSPTDPDYLPWLILNDILGGKPFTSRLWSEVREKRGLVYDIRTELVHWDLGHLCMGSFETDTAKVNEVIQLVRDEWEKIAHQTIEQGEFESSKTGLLGNFALNFTRPEDIASYLLSCHLSGLPMDYINQRNQLLEKVTLADVNRVAKKAFNVNHLSFVVVGGPKSSKAFDPRKDS